MEKEQIMIKGSLTYKCDDCNKQWKMFLECGVGSCKSDKSWKQCEGCKLSNGVMPCPFIIGCLCGGTAKHIDWHKDTFLPHPMPVFDHMSYFKLDREGLKNKNLRAHGIPIVRKASMKDNTEG